MKTFALLYLSTLCVMSGVAVIAYAFDKRRAQIGGWRLSEKSLHMIGLFGGWPGALVGQKLFRHKTQKLGFQVISWLVAVLNLALAAGIVWLILSFSAPAQS